MNNPRKDFEVKIIEKHTYMKDLIVFVLEVGKGFALKASRPGSYVFLKAPDMEDFYNAPISVLKSDVEKGYLHLAIKSLSGKTKLIAACEETLDVRGVYRNGVLGIKDVIGSRGRIDDRKKTLIIAKGVGFAPGALLAEWASPKAEVDFLLDLDKITSELIRDYLPDRLNGKAKSVDLNAIFNQQNRVSGIVTSDSFDSPNYDLAGFIKKGKYDIVVALTSDYYIDEIRKLLENAREIDSDCVPALTAYANNYHICCGEGICGACSKVDENGNVFKMCKCCEV